jgi:hypothetical protein
MIEKLFYAVSGCEFMHENGTVFKPDVIQVRSEASNVKPILRPMWTLTSSEMKMIGVDVNDIRTNPRFSYTPEIVKMLICFGIDCFGVIESGDAISLSDARKEVGV